MERTSLYGSEWVQLDTSGRWLLSSTQVNIQGNVDGLFSHLYTMSRAGNTAQVLWLGREMQQFDWFNSTKELEPALPYLSCAYGIPGSLLESSPVTASPNYPGRRIPLLSLFYRWRRESLLYLCALTQSLATKPQLPQVTSKWQSWNLTLLGFRTCALNP